MANGNRRERITTILIIISIDQKKKAVPLRL